MRPGPLFVFGMPTGALLGLIIGAIMNKAGNDPE